MQLEAMLNGASRIALAGLHESREESDLDHVVHLTCIAQIAFAEEGALCVDAGGVECAVVSAPHTFIDIGGAVGALKSAQANALSAQT